jgi:hypothetical protein
VILAACLAGCSQQASNRPSGEGVAPTFTAIPGTPPSYAPAENASAGVVRQSQPWSFNNDTGKTLTTDNFVIYTTERSNVITQRMPAFLEAALANYRTAVGPLPTPARSIDVYVMNDRAQWQALTLSVLGERGHAVVNGIRRGGFTTQGKSLLYDIGAFDTMSIAAHEAWHAYTQTTFTETLPMWAEEGLATFMEGHRWNGAAPQFSGWANIARFDRLRVAVKDNALMPLEAVLASSPNQMIGMKGLLADQQFGAAGFAPGNGATDGPVLWYSQVWSLVHFLNEGEGGKYRPAFQQMIQDAAGGQMRAKVLSNLKKPGDTSRPRLLASQAPTEAFRAYFGNDLSTVGAEYDRFCRQMVKVGSREAVTLGKSPFAQPLAK